MILDLVRAFRPMSRAVSDRAQTVAWGPGPRAAQALMLAVRARALLQGRLAPNAEDVLDMAQPVLSHRMALNFAARARGESLAALIAGNRGELARTGGRRVTRPAASDAATGRGGGRGQRPAAAAGAGRASGGLCPAGRAWPPPGGLGDDFWQYRPAQAGDSRRMIDHRRSAMGDVQFVREREWQIAQSVMLWVDHRRLDALCLDKAQPAAEGGPRAPAGPGAAILLVRAASVWA